MSAYTKFCCGFTIINIETCTYGLNRVPAEQRLCDECKLIEDEFHVLKNAISDIDYQFATYSQYAKFTQMMLNPLYYKIVSKALFSILNKRRHINFH